MTDREPTIEEMRAAWEAAQKAKAKMVAYRKRPEVKARQAAYMKAYMKQPEASAKRAARYADLVRLAKLAKEAGLG